MANHSHAHICQCLTRISTLKQDSVITVARDRRRTGREFVHGVLSLAGGLIGLGVRKGDVVAVAALNSDVYLEWILAVSFVGGIVAPLNYRWSFKEARMAMLMVEPVLLVTDESCASWILEMQSDTLPSLKWHVSMEFASSNIVNEHTCLTTEMLKERSVRSPPSTYSWAPDGAVLICFTSGTTGRPKGVTISHSAIIVQSLAKVAIVGYGEDDVYLHTAPLCHIGGLSSAMAMLMVGGCHILPPKFEAVAALQAIEQHHVTSLITVPAMMADLISFKRARENGMQQESVRKILNGGGSLSSELIKYATKIFPRAKIHSAYGMTEACSSLTFMTLCDPTPESPNKDLQMFYTANFKLVHRLQGICVGKPAPHVELKVHVDGSSRTGKILTRGSHVMLRYWGQVQAKTSSDSGSGDWLDTGDVGSIDEYGNLWLIGRANGRIKSGGENVYPEEVEAVLLQHPGIMSVVVVGIADARLAEMVVACIRLKENWKWSEKDEQNHWDGNRDLALSSEILRHHCRTQSLTRFKTPKLFIPWKERFPVTTTGKIRRDEVRREVMSRLQILPSCL